MQSLATNPTGLAVPGLRGHVLTAPRNILYIGPTRGLELNFAILDQVERGVKQRFGVNGRVSFFDSSTYTGNPNARIGHVSFGEKTVTTIAHMDLAGEMLRHIRFLVVDNLARELGLMMFVRMREITKFEFGAAMIIGSDLALQWIDPDQYLQPQAHLIG